MKTIRYVWISLSLLCYLSVLIPPDLFSFGVLLGYSIPVVIIFSFFVMIISRKWWSVIVPICGIPFILSTIQFSKAGEPTEDSFTVMSFNAKLFRRPGSYREFSGEMIDWTANDLSEIKVIPEHSTDARWKPLDINRRISEKGYDAFSVAAPIKDNEHNLGSAIFSKFKPVKTGTVFTDSSSISMAIYEDVLIGEDTIRIYSVHLASQQLETIVASGRISRFVQVCKKLMRGAVKHSEQLDHLFSNIEQCRHPYIICGDFNETPYSYNYWRMRRHTTDAFIDEGNGLGLTFSSANLLVRIDYQFVSEGIVVEKLESDKLMRLSDHLPVRGRYRLSR